MQEGGLHGYLAGAFAVVVVGHGSAGGDGAHAIDDAGTGQHGFGKHGLAGGRVAHDGKVSDVACLILFH